MIQPSFKEFQRLAKQGNLIPVYDVLPADLLTPVSAYLRIAQGARYSFLLESVEGGEKIARYTFAGANPEEVFRYASGACVLEGRERVVWEEKNPVAFLRARMEKFRPVRVPGLPPLVAGAIGYFSYDMVRLIERIPDTTRDDVGMDDAVMMFFLGLVVFDHVRHRVWAWPCLRSSRSAGNQNHSRLLPISHAQNSSPPWRNRRNTFALGIFFR